MSASNTSTTVLVETRLPLPLYRQGKVRDVYELDNKLLIVSTDRISAFDVVLPCGIPGKGAILNQISAFWFERTAHILTNHLAEMVDSLGVLREADKTKPGQPAQDYPDYLVGRSMITAKAERVPVECIVRGYLAGSAWQEYQEKGMVGGVALPPGMQESEELPEIMFTPTTKSEAEHDRPLEARDIQELGIADILPILEEKSRLIYSYARNFAKSKGIIIADTKFEFGYIDSKLAIIDELLTPDSSRFWEIEGYKIGQAQDSFDKQPIRDWLTNSGWNKTPPAPMLPQEIIKATTLRYNKIYHLFTGRSLNVSG